MSDKPTMGVEVNIRSKSSNSDTAKLSTPKSNASETQADSPFCMTIMGDFSGSLNHNESIAGIQPKARLIEIDRDNFEDVMASFKINLSLKLSDSENIHVEINELDDFHPDELYDKLESFSKLRSLHRRLKSKSSFSEAASEIQNWLPENHITKNSSSAQPETSENLQAEIPTDNLLDSILSSQQSQSADKTASEATHIDKLIKSIVAPYVEAATDPRQKEMLAMVDIATESHMRDVLHHADFQAMEAIWQSVYFLIKRIETGSRLKILLLDITKQELQQDLAVDDITTSSLYKLFCDPSEGDRPWSLLLGNYSFNDNIDDILSLASIGEIAKQANAPFIAAAHETLTGCEALSKTPDYEDWNHTVTEGVSKAWLMLRQSPVARYIGLALPRFLLRLPYGKKSKPIDAFSFEEIKDKHNHESYLWGNPAFIKAECMARNFNDNGWNMQINEIFQTDNLPVHYYDDEGETVNKPLAEIMLTEKGGEIMSENGLMPLWSVRNMDCIRSSDYRSIAENAETISGRWK
ncbi:MAG: type VI secretion system contractile sheath large subunit [Gammaproteobacteria bacterium]|nr:type VI secretion system contractile sheath large subunit [Gammaproteobacteria bacterium]